MYNDYYRSSEEFEERISRLVRRWRTSRWWRLWYFLLAGWQEEDIRDCEQFLGKRMR